MGKKLTEGQKLARIAVRAAVKKMIAALDENDTRCTSVLFEAHFHLDCWRFDRGYGFGRPIQSGMPIYASAWTGRRQPTAEESAKAASEYARGR